MSGQKEGSPIGSQIMVAFRIEFARREGYQFVVLEAPKETPAFGFYLSEGFLVEKEMALPIMPLCVLRRPLAEKGPESDAADCSP